MRRADAPPPGWYPAPEGGARLRWWDGTDWSDLYRAPPSRSELEIRAMQAARTAATPHPGSSVPSAHDLTSLRRREAEEIAAQVRQVARAEIERAADIFSARARAATDQIQPLVSQYTSTLLRWLRIAAVVALLVVVGWFVFQAIAQVTFFDWLGDRIDGLTD